MKPLMLGIMCLFLVGFVCPAVDSEEITSGKLIANVVCTQDSRFSYALYLPQAYSHEKKWPVIFGFDPSARGEIPVERFIPAAETYGYIVVGSLDARNGPAQPVIDASSAVWKDVRDRFAVDDKRVYAAGFSGGAEMAAMFPQNILKRIAGIICCGTALPPKYSPAGLSQTLYFGIMGRKDFLFLDMARLGRLLDENKVLHRIMYFDGWHQWPSETLLTEAVEWLELKSMQKGIQEKDIPFIQDNLTKRILHADLLFEGQRWVESFQSYAYIRSDFDGLADPEMAEVGLEKLSSAKKYREQSLEMREIEKSEAAQMQRIHAIFAALDKTASNDLTLGGISRELRLDDLIRSGAKSASFLQSESAQRLLSLIILKADRGGLPALQRRDFPRAVIFFQVAEKAGIYHPLYPQLIYDLVRVYSLWDKKGEALEQLRQAIDAGYQAADVIAEDPDLENIRSEPEYRMLLKKIRLK